MNGLRVIMVICAIADHGQSSALRDNVPAKVRGIIADSSKIWFSFGEPGISEARMSAVAAVFGLSTTPSRCPR